MNIPTELIVRLQKGEESAYGEFMASYGGQLLNFGYRMCGDREDAKDVLQDTLLTTLESISRLKEPKAFGNWLYKVAHNACLMKRRRSKFLRKEISHDETAPDRASLALVSWPGLPEEVVLNRELHEKLTTAIDNLPDTYHSVLVLRDIEELDTKNVAVILGLSKDVVKMRLHRARSQVRNELEDYLKKRGPGG